jgi:uncharacterized protein
LVHFAVLEVGLNIFKPDWYIESVVQLDAAWLRAVGLDALLLDVDCTLKRYPDDELLPDVQKWIDALRGAGIRLCLVSNGVGHRIGRLAERHGLPFVAMAVKPLPFGCRRAVWQQRFDLRRTAMVGDQLLADVVAGNLAGLKTVLVRAIHPEDEPWFTRVKRPFERWLLGGRQPDADLRP